MKRSYCGAVRVSCAGSDSTVVVVSSSATSLPTSGSDQSATNSVDHRLEAVVRAELLIHVVQDHAFLHCFGAHQASQTHSRFPYTLASPSPVVMGVTRPSLRARFVAGATCRK